MSTDTKTIIAAIHATVYFPIKSTFCATIIATISKTDRTINYSSNKATI